MKFSRLVSVLLASKAMAVAIPEAQRAGGGKVTEVEVLQALLDNPNLLPSSSYRFLKYRVSQWLGQVVKRAPQMSTATVVGGLGVVGAVFESLFPPPKRAPTSRVSDTTDSMSVMFPGALRRKIRYGPYRLPPTSEKNLEAVYLHTPGMGNTFKYDAKKPCDKDCVVLSMEMSLEFDDGTTAENSNGAWFHHAVLLTAGPSARTAICGNIPIEVIGMVGNEKASVTFAAPNATEIKAGYHLSARDALVINSQLMNMEDKEKFVWLTTTYDYVDGKQPDYLRSHIFWQFLSSNTEFPCLPNHVNPFGPSNLTIDLQPKSLKFSEKTIPVEAGIDGVILATGGHMHDGGTGIDIFKNNEMICNSATKYSKTSQGGGHGHARRDVSLGHSHDHIRRQLQPGAAKGSESSNKDIEHIVDQTRCMFPNGIPVSKKDLMHISANYDFHLHQGMKNDKGELDGVMGIVGMVIAQKE